MSFQLLYSDSWRFLYVPIVWHIQAYHQSADVPGSSILLWHQYTYCAASFGSKYCFKILRHTGISRNGGWSMLSFPHLCLTSLITGDSISLYGWWHLNKQGSHFFGDTKFHVFSVLFPGKSNEIPGQFGSESQCLCW